MLSSNDVCLFECIQRCAHTHTLADTHTQTRTHFAHLTSALRAVIDGPFILVLVDDAIVQTDATVDADAVHQQLVLIRLEDRKQEIGNRKQTDIS